MRSDKRKFNLNTLLRELILVNRYKADRHSAVFEYNWQDIHYNRVAVVNLLMSQRPEGDYLEIGCAGNALFDSVAASNKVGVDPQRGGTHRLTSDAFFATCDSGPFDVVFIDGLHLYDQVRRDLDGALRVLKSGGWIALHDMLPRDWFEEHVPQIRTRGWTGDGWKVAFELLASPDVEFRLVAIDHGVLVVKPLAAAPHIPDLSATLRGARFAYFHDNFARLPVVDYPAAAAWITAHGRNPPRGGAQS
jgi:hypothetical protein